MLAWSFFVDLIILGVAAFGAWRGYREGMLTATANLIGLVLSLLFAYAAYPPVSQVFLSIWTIPPSIANVFAFLFLTFTIDGLVTALVLFVVGKYDLSSKQPEWSRWIGSIFGTINAIITVAFITSLFTALPLEHPLKTSVTGSTVAKPMIAATRMLGAPIDQLVAPAITDLSQLFTIEPDSKEMVELPFRVQNPSLSPEEEEGMLALLNQERTTRGLQPVVKDDELRSLARGYSLDMFQRGFFSHYTPEGLDPFDRMIAAGIEYQAAGENLALAPTLHMAHTGLMNSPGHKRNILDPSYKKVGIGAYKDPRYGIIFTQEFTN